MLVPLSKRHCCITLSLKQTPIAFHFPLSFSILFRHPPSILVAMKTNHTASAAPRLHLIATGLVALLLGAGCASVPYEKLPASGETVSSTHQVTTKTGAATVTVTFTHPEKFTDLKTSLSDTDKDRSSLLEVLRDYVVEQAAPYLGAGQTFAVTFTDIKMAGDFEPTHSAALQDVRIIKSIYPPRIALDFSLKNADGAIAADGARNLTDMNFMSTIPVPTLNDNRLRHEKTLLHNWLAREFNARGQTR
jgi:hypothetical protein